MTWSALLSELMWKSSLILAVAFGASWLARRRSAALRHFLWTAVFAALLVLPAVVRVVPRWSPARPVAAAARDVPGAAVRIRPAAGRPRPALPWLLLVWPLGLALAACRFLAGAWRTACIVRRAAPAPYAGTLLPSLVRTLALRRTVRVLETSAVPIPLAWGLRLPVVLLPKDAASWPEPRLRTVLLHELIHIQRLDVAAQAVAQAVCSLYWFQPLAWLALGRLRRERERACDDAVLLGGVPAPDYAAHLIDMVRAVSGRPARWSGSPAMAQASDLETRVRALLDRHSNRRPLSRRFAIATAAAVAIALLPFASVSTRAQTARGSIAGVVEDPSGSRVPKCRVTARNLDGSNQEKTTANPAGEYQFTSIPAGRYALEFEARGFALAKAEVVLVAGATARVDGRLELGAVVQDVVIQGQKPPSVAPRAANPQRIPVGGSVVAARLVSQPRPAYPAELQQLGVEGTVVMSAIISKEGAVLSPVVRNTVDARLAQAALDAVKQWRYEPALLNGHPVETITTITLEFQLAP